MFVGQSVYLISEAFSIRLLLFGMYAHINLLWNKILEYIFLGASGAD